MRLVNPQGVRFGSATLANCIEARVIAKPASLRGERGDGQRYESHVEAEGLRYIIEVDCEESPTTGLRMGTRGALSFTVEKAEGSGTMTVNAPLAMVAGEKTRFRNEGKGMTITTVRFVCVSSDGVTDPVSIT